MPPVSSSPHITSLKEQVQTFWEAIALHTTRGVTQYMRSEVVLLCSGMALDVLGTGFDQFPSELRDEIVARYPREHFKEGVVEAVFGSFAHKPGTTYGTAFVGVSERFISWAELFQRGLSLIA